MSQKIAFFDIETAPAKGYYFELYKEGNILWTEKDWYILSFAWKWLGDKRVNVVALPDFPLFKEDKTDDSILVGKLWNLFDNADILVAHHGDMFDIKKSNARFIKYGLKPPSPYKTIDTRKIARKYFKFDSNKLNALGQYLNVGRKLKHTGADLWKDCMEGDTKAWRLMREYNKRDVILLEKVYNKMLGWIGNHPNYTLETKDECPNCGSCITYKRGFNITRSRRYQRFQCKNCGAWWQGKIDEDK